MSVSRSPRRHERHRRADVSGGRQRFEVQRCQGQLAAQDDAATDGSQQIDVAGCVVGAVHDGCGEVGPGDNAARRIAGCVNNLQRCRIKVKVGGDGISQLAAAFNDQIELGDAADILGTVAGSSRRTAVVGAGETAIARSTTATISPLR